MVNLAYGCRLYAESTGFDASINVVRDVAPGGIDLNDERHATALLHWLNKWGCRQFAVAYHGEARAMLAHPIRYKLSFDSGGRGYLSYLLHVRDQATSLEQEAAELGIAAPDIPAALGRPASSIPKLIDEYYWITITRRHALPSPAEFARWHEWSGGVSTVDAISLIG